MSPEYHLKRNKTTKKKTEKLLHQQHVFKNITIAIRFNLPQQCPSVPPFVSVLYYFYFLFML